MGLTWGVGLAWGGYLGGLGGYLGGLGGYPGAGLGGTLGLAWGGLEKACFFRSQFWCFLAPPGVKRGGFEFFRDSPKNPSKKGYRGREKKCPRYPFFPTAPPLGQLWKVGKMS